MSKVKQKSHRGAGKRFRLTGKGKVKFRAANRAHCLGDKNRSAKRALRSPGPRVAHCDENAVLRMLLQK